VATPEANDLAEIAQHFIHFANTPPKEIPSHPVVYRDCPFVKLAPPSAFDRDERWDVLRHWTDEEQVALGERTQTISREEFIDIASSTLAELVEELQQAREELARLRSGPTATFSLGDESRFQVRSGVRIRNADLREHPGDVPVYSVFTRAETVKGHIDLEWLRTEKGVEPERWPSVTIMATGASAVGMVFYREAAGVMTDDVVIVQPWPTTKEPPRPAAGEDPLPEHDIDLGFLVVALADSIAQGGYLYEAKLYTRRVRQLTIDAPVDRDGEPDLERQRLIASASKRLDSIRSRLEEAGKWSREVRLA
jgi:hypothetical protein